MAEGTMLAAQCAETAIEVRQPLRKEIERRVALLVPPASPTEFQTLLQLGEVAGPVLPSPARQDEHGGRASIIMTLAHMRYEPATRAAVKLLEDSSQTRRPFAILHKMTGTTYTVAGMRRRLRGDIDQGLRRQRSPPSSTPCPRLTQAPFRSCGSSVKRNGIPRSATSSERSSPAPRPPTRRSPPPPARPDAPHVLVDRLGERHRPRDQHVLKLDALDDPSTSSRSRDGTGSPSPVLREPVTLQAEVVDRTPSPAHRRARASISPFSANTKHQALARASSRPAGHAPAWLATCHARAVARCARQAQ